MADKTIIVIWGDHGFHLGDHGLWCKHTNFEQATHSPLLIFSPGQQKAGEPHQEPVEFVDIYPTMCDLAGLPTPPHCEGKSLLEATMKNAPGGRKYALSQYPRGVGSRPRYMGYSLRGKRFRYTEWRDRWKNHAVVGVELYDYENDPRETQNLGTDTDKHTLLDFQQALSDRLERQSWRGR
jgi:arylsulfatase A-like enzyme